MTQEHGKERDKTPSDRRAGRDRRKVDKPPPGGRERRVSIEPRKPEVLEFEVTPSDWAALQDQLAPGSGRGGPALKK